MVKLSTGEYLWYPVKEKYKGPPGYRHQTIVRPKGLPWLAGNNERIIKEQVTMRIQ